MYQVEPDLDHIIDRLWMKHQISVRDLRWLSDRARRVIKEQPMLLRLEAPIEVSEVHSSESLQLTPGDRLWAASMNSTNSSSVSFKIGECHLESSISSLATMLTLGPSHRSAWPCFVLTRYDIPTASISYEDNMMTMMSQTAITASIIPLDAITTLGW